MGPRTIYVSPWSWLQEESVRHLLTRNPISLSPHRHRQEPQSPTNWQQRQWVADYTRNRAIGSETRLFKKPQAVSRCVA